MQKIQASKIFSIKLWVNLDYLFRSFFVKVQNQELVGSRKHTALGGMPR